MVLSKAEIYSRLHYPSSPMMSNFVERNIQTTSYDLRMGEHYCLPLHSDTGRENVHIGTLNRNQQASFTLLPNTLCYVETKETISMPNDLTAIVSIAFSLIRTGILMASQPPFDPGYKGKIFALLYNLSDREITIALDDHILTIMFATLSTPVIPSDMYKGQYTDMTLGQFCSTGVTNCSFYSSLKEFRENVNEINKIKNKHFDRMTTFITILLTCMTVLIAILVGFVTFITFRNSSNPPLSPPITQSPQPTTSLPPPLEEQNNE